MPGNLQILHFLDCFELIGSLRPRMNLFKETDEGVRLLPIRWPDDENAEVPVWKGAVSVQKAWPELRNVISRVQKLGEQRAGPVERGRSFFEMLEPGTTMPWRREAGAYWSSGYMRFQLALRTNPFAFMYAGGEAISLASNWIAFVNPCVDHCAINLGQHQRVHLVIDMRKKDVAETRP